jgi:trimeric autotransporter adhesin
LSVWGDIEQGSGVAAVTATADDNFSFHGVNNSGSGWPTAYFANNSTTGALLWAFGGGGGYLIVDINGNLYASGSINGSVKNFRIDHPLDPANKYLNHASVESSEMKNIYDGVATFDASGAATVQLPDWFEAMNGDFRYQLTCIGGFSPVYIGQEIAEHYFTIAGGKPGMKVSWQVTGVRHDAYAQAHPLQVEEEKPEKERGYYVHPELHGASPEKSLSAALYPQRLKRKLGISEDNPKLRSLTKSFSQVRPARP